MVLDAGTGQNALSQLRHFDQTVSVSGLCLTKLDGTAKGGILLALAHAHGIPIRFIGIGEQAGDLRAFRAEEFVDAMLPDPRVD
jgi:fused signal recognition particle receptor